MEWFVKKGSIVRRIWGNSDTILLIFGGAAAEFALNKAVDWLYFTGRLPADPIGRLFSTVTYARYIVFAPKEGAEASINKMRMIHSAVESNRGAQIPDWAYRDVLFMLIHYSISSFELLYRKLNDDEKEEVFNVFYRVGIGMGLKELPASYKEWLPVYEQHLQKDLQKSEYTVDLFKQYKKHLGASRYKVLIEAQKLVVPKRVHDLLALDNFSWITPALPLYKISRFMKLDGLIKLILLPRKYRQQIADLNSNDL